MSLARSGESVCESELHIGSSDDQRGAPTVRELTVELGATVDELVGGVVSGECTYALARSPLVQPERYAPRRVQEGEEDQGRDEHHRRRQPEQLQVPTAPDGAVQAGMEGSARRRPGRVEPVLDRHVHHGRPPGAHETRAEDQPLRRDAGDLPQTEPGQEPGAARVGVPARY